MSVWWIGLIEWIGVAGLNSEWILLVRKYGVTHCRNRLKGTVLTQLEYMDSWASYGSTVLNGAGAVWDQRNDFFFQEYHGEFRTQGENVVNSQPSTAIFVGSQKDPKPQTNFKSFQKR